MIISFTIPDDKAQMIIDGICTHTGWTAASGVTKGQWAKDKLVVTIKEMARVGLLVTSRDTIDAEVSAVAIT